MLGYAVPLTKCENMRYHLNNMHSRNNQEWQKPTKCARLACEVIFTPSRSWQVYHDARCRFLDRFERKDVRIEGVLKVCEELIAIARGENRSTKIYRGLCVIRRELTGYLGIQK